MTTLHCDHHVNLLDDTVLIAITCVLIYILCNWPLPSFLLINYYDPSVAYVVNYRLTYQDTRLTAQCDAFHLVEHITDCYIRVFSLGDCSRVF